MYINSVHIENLKCFESIRLKFQAARKGDEGYDPQFNWNVILGNNGDGKTTLLQAIATCLMDVTTAQRVLKPAGWLRSQQSHGRITVALEREAEDLIVMEDRETTTRYQVQYIIKEVEIPTPHARWATISSISPMGRVGNDARPLAHSPFRPLAVTAPPTTSGLFDKSAALQLNRLSQTYLFTREKRKGWISCGYGPFRRLYGLSSQSANITDSLEERFITLFDEGGTLYKYETWLKDLQLLALKNGLDSPQQRSLEKAKELIYELLPQIDEIEIDERVTFWRKGRLFNLNQLSDGYRSMFALIVDLLRWLEMLRPDIETPINEASGVLLIDEIDTHLHPKWQREIGFWLTKTFPNMQFIVTTHSPFVAMAAAQGALTVLEKCGDAVIAKQEHPFIRDWAVNRVLTHIFEVNEHSWATEQAIKKYEALRSQKIAGILDEGGQKRLAALEADLNKRLADDRDSPKQRTLESDLAELELLLLQASE